MNYKNWITEAVQTLANPKKLGDKNPDSVYSSSNKKLKIEVNEAIQKLLYGGKRKDEVQKQIENTDEAARPFMIEVAMTRLALMQNVEDVYRAKVIELLRQLCEHWPEAYSHASENILLTWGKMPHLIESGALDNLGEKSKKSSKRKI